VEETAILEPPARCRGASARRPGNRCRGAPMLCRPPWRGTLSGIRPRPSNPRRPATSRHPSGRGNGPRAHRILGPTRPIVCVRVRRKPPFPPLSPQSVRPCSQIAAMTDHAVHFCAHHGLLAEPKPAAEHANRRNRRAGLQHVSSPCLPPGVDPAAERAHESSSGASAAPPLTAVCASVAQARLGRRTTIC